MIDDLSTMSIIDRRSMIYRSRSIDIYRRYIAIPCGYIPIAAGYSRLYTPGIPGIPEILGGAAPRDPRKIGIFRGYLIILQFGTPQDTGFLGHPPEPAIYGQDICSNPVYILPPGRGGTPRIHMTSVRQGTPFSAIFGLFGL